MDDEINAMSKLAEALANLDEGARGRVLRWASERFGVPAAPTPPTNQGNGQQETPNTDDSAGNSNSSPTEEFETFAELFAQANPPNEAMKVLVAGYWHQVVQSDGEITSAKLNKDLKDLGHSILNINQKFDTLMGAKPQLAIQLKKSGNAKQARKKYKVTKAGISKVEEMLKGQR